MPRKGLLAVVMVGIVVAIAVVIAAVVIVVVPAISYTNHIPISINGNSSFTSANGVTSGSGTENDPYIIENWAINASSANGLDIRNTTAYFIVRNCLVENVDLSTSYAGIVLNNVINGEIENNICRHSPVGIWLQFSSNIIIGNNTCSGNSSVGIALGSVFYSITADNNTIYNNTCSSNGDDGIDVNLSSGNIIFGNTCSENPFYGIKLDTSSNNAIFLNYLLNNGNNAYDDGTDNWDNNGKGNYWSDWQPPAHPDNNGDNIVDEPRPIESGSNQDSYPLVIAKAPFPWWLLVIVVILVVFAVFVYRKSKKKVKKARGAILKHQKGRFLSIFLGRGLKFNFFSFSHFYVVHQFKILSFF